MLMPSASGKLENTRFWDDMVEQIAKTFQVPRLTASSWKREIGDLETIEQTLGKNAIGDYLTLIRRREWIPVEMEEREDELIQPLKKWAVKNADEIVLVHESEREQLYNKRDYSGVRSFGVGSGWRAVEFDSPSGKKQGPRENDGVHWSDEMARLQEELERKEDQVRYEISRLDSEWIGLARELWDVEQSLVEMYNSYLQGTEKSFQYKKDKIIELKEAFPYLRANNDFTARVAGSSTSYASQFKGSSEGEITNQKVTGNLRDQVFDRDYDSCVCCESDEELVIHHVIPHNKGGKNELANLAVLCQECHYYAHGGGKPTDDGRYTAAKWGGVEYSDRKEFWNDWINQDFEDRAPKDHTRIDM
jgi:hypothetical protein